MNIKTAALVSALLITVDFTAAQAPDDRQLDRQVDVSRDYTPDVERAMKLPIAPDIRDTVSLRPDFDYTITPNPWSTGFGVTAINPVRVSPSAYNPIYPFYLKAGGGAPGQTILDLYANTTGTGGGHAGAYVNHYGQFGKIRNDIGYKARGLHSTNSVGLFGKAVVGRRTYVQGEAGYDYDIWSRYGQAVDINAGSYVPVDKKSSLQSYSVPRARFTFGHDFSDLSYFNFRIGAGTYMVKDRKDNKETGLNTFLEVGKAFSVHNFTLKGEFDGAFGGDMIQGEIHRQYKLGVGYAIEADRFKIGAGADYVYSSISSRRTGDMLNNAGTETDMLWNYRTKHDDGKSFFLPRFHISYDLGYGSFVPYAKLESSIVNNSFYNITRDNPYLRPLSGVAVDTRKYDFRAGFTGSIATNFMYNVYVGGGVHKKPAFFYTEYMDVGQTDYINVLTDDRMKIFTAGAEMDVRISGSFSAGLAVHYYDYSMKNFDHASGLPKFEGTLSLRYNYRDKFKVRAEADILGKRKFMEYSRYRYIGPAEPDEFLYYTKQKAAADISLEAEYAVNKKFGVFLLGRNLANSKIYRFNHYPDRGISVSTGIKLMF